MCFVACALPYFVGILFSWRRRFEALQRYVDASPIKSTQLQHVWQELTINSPFFSLFLEEFIDEHWSSMPSTITTYVNHIWTHLWREIPLSHIIICLMTTGLVQTGCNRILWESKNTIRSEVGAAKYSISALIIYYLACIYRVYTNL